MAGTRFHSSRRNESRHMEQLADRICASLGRPPRPLPSRTRLAVEDASRRVSVIAGIVAVTLFVISQVAVSDPPSPASSVITSAVNGTLPRAEDVYLRSRMAVAEGGSGR
jgi:hypothetical protein